MINVFCLPSWELTTSIAVLQTSLRSPIWPPLFCSTHPLMYYQYSWSLCGFKNRSIQDQNRNSWWTLKILNVFFLFVICYFCLLHQHFVLTRNQQRSKLNQFQGFMSQFIFVHKFFFVLRLGRFGFALENNEELLSYQSL